MNILNTKLLEQPANEEVGRLGETYSEWIPLATNASLRLADDRKTITEVGEGEDIKYIIKSTNSKYIT